MIAQLGITLFGVTAVWLSQSAEIRFQRWASVFGLLGQPFWFWTSIEHKQWGILALCFLYSYSWFRGFKRFWLKKEAAK